MSFLAVAEKYNIQETVDKCNTFILENVDVISQSKEFTDISKEQLLTYLSDDRLNVRNGEIEVFRAALKWFEAELEKPPIHGITWHSLYIVEGEYLCPWRRTTYQRQ